jgi:ABC-type phosphate/phosphonate transport system substrate-binding protein
MKKLWIITLAAALAMLVSACGVGDVGGASSQPASSQVSSSASSQLGQDGVEDSLKGLEQYMTANASFSGTPTSMRADVIGAKQGDRYQFGYNGKNNVTVELYEFDSSNLNETAKKTINDAKSSGKITILDQQVNAVLSDSGKYLMIFQNSATDDQNKAYTDQVKKLFTGFKA